MDRIKWNYDRKYRCIDQVYWGKCCVTKFSTSWVCVSVFCVMIKINIFYRELLCREPENHWLSNGRTRSFLLEYIVPCDKYLLNIYSIPDIGFSYENTKRNTGLLPPDDLPPNNTRTPVIITQRMLRTANAEVCWEQGITGQMEPLLLRGTESRQEAQTGLHRVAYDFILEKRGAGKDRQKGTPTDRLTPTKSEMRSPLCLGSVEVLEFRCRAWTFQVTFKPRGRVKVKMFCFQSFWIVNNMAVFDLDLQTIAFKSKVFQKEEFSSNEFKPTFSEEGKKLLV